MAYLLGDWATDRQAITMKTADLYQAFFIFYRPSPGGKSLKERVAKWVWPFSMRGIYMEMPMNMALVHFPCL